MARSMSAEQNKLGQCVEDATATATCLFDVLYKLPSCFALVNLVGLLPPNVSKCQELLDVTHELSAVVEQGWFARGWCYTHCRLHGSSTGHRPVHHVGGRSRHMCNMLWSAFAHMSSILCS